MVMKQAEIKWDDTADVIVVGSGFAGLTAAIEAHNAGASVVVLEKMAAPGGNSIISDGGIAAAGTAEQRSAGIEDAPDLMYRDMMNAGLGLNHPGLVKEVTERSNEVLRWTIEYLGVEYLDRLDIFGGHSVPRCYTPIGISGSAIIKQQLLKLHELGMSIKTRTYLKRLIVDDTGTVTGVSVRENYDHKNPESGTDNYVQARKAVILAAGGFGADIPFRSAQDPRLNADIDTTNKPFATAEVLKEALRIGAAPVHLSHIQLGAWASPDEKGFGVGPLFADYIVFPLGLVVEPFRATRIVNELADRKTVSDTILRIGKPCIGIADQQAVTRSGWNIDHCVAKGVVRGFERLPDLAAHYGLPDELLERSIDTFNGHVEERNDLDFGKPFPPTAAPIKQPPYYAMRLWPKVHHTMGGVHINVRGQVLDLDQHPIHGLYAAGEITGGIHGACRLGSCAITDCLVFGRICGRNAAAESAPAFPR